MKIGIEQLEDRVVLDHSHIPIDFVGGEIFVQPSSYGLVFPGLVDTQGGGFTVDPSITDNGGVSHLTPGSTIYYSVLGPLMVHNGTSFVTPTTQTVSFLLPAGATVTGTSSDQGPFAYGTVAGDGTMHVHPLVQVFSTTTAAIGVQLQLSTNAPGVEDSDPFWLVYNYNLSTPAMNAAMTAFASLGGVSADAGGPYSGTEGTPIALVGGGSGGITLYEWDFDNDGEYDDAVGQNVLFAPTDNGVYQIGLRVTGASGTATDTTTVTVANAAPVAGVVGPTTGVRGQPRSYTLSAADPSSVDQAANFTFQIDWNGDGVFDQTVVAASGTVVEHVFATSGSYTVRVRATDKDGGISGITSQGVSISDWALQVDEQNPSKTNLVWGGTNGADAFAFVPGLVLTQLANNQYFPTPLLTFVGGFNGKLIVYSQGGPDLLFADVMNLPIQFNGGDGDDVLIGGRESDTLYGGAGNDILFGGTLNTDAGDVIYGGSGHDLIVGHLGADTLLGGLGNDLIVAGSVSFGDDIAAAAYSIHSEWMSERPIGQKVANISGTGSGPRFNYDYFLQPAVTVFDDASVDVIFGEENDDWLLVNLAVDLSPDLSSADVATDIG